MTTKRRVESTLRAVSTVTRGVIENSLVLRTLLVVEIALAWLWLS